ncbi:MAG: hypothetical protein Q7S86_02740 [bacterium]|nr:hypothetical protein [bacterium]
MKFIQKSSDKKVLLVVIILAALLMAGDVVYSRLSITENTAPQFSSAEDPIAPFTALDPSTSAVAFSFDSSTDLLKVCPSEKIVNKMPTTMPNSNPPSTYFILNGERRELSEFDLSWVAGNCSVEEQVVY